MTPLRSVLLIGLLSAVDAGSPGGALDVEVKGLRAGGLVWVTLFDDAAAFPTKRLKALKRIDAVPEQGRARVSFEGLPPGDYAVAVLHDKNGDGKVEANFIGIPTEGLGCSRDAPGLFGPPSFRDAKLRVEGGRLSVPITVRY